MIHCRLEFEWISHFSHFVMSHDGGVRGKFQCITWKNCVKINSPNGDAVYAASRIWVEKNPLFSLFFLALSPASDSGSCKKKINDILANELPNDGDDDDIPAFVQKFMLCRARIHSACTHLPIADAKALLLPILIYVFIMIFSKVINHPFIVLQNAIM